MKEIIRFDNVVKMVNGHRVINGVRFIIHEGGVYAYLRRG